MKTSSFGQSQLSQQKPISCWPVSLSDGFIFAASSGYRIRLILGVSTVDVCSRLGWRGSCKTNPLLMLGYIILKKSYDMTTFFTALTQPIIS
jgi:hypothetical protein